MPLGLYGASTAPGNWSGISNCSTAVAGSYMGKGNEATRHTGSVVLAFYACGTNPYSTADPWHWILHKRVSDFRRARVKRPHLRTKLQELINVYTQQKRPGTQQENPTPDLIITMPTGRHVNGGQWLWEPRPPGPLALLPQSAAVHNTPINTAFTHSSKYGMNTTSLRPLPTTSRDPFT